jgi:hypothetical protein
MLRAAKTSGPGGPNRLTSRWLFHALPHQIDYAAVQSPVYPFRIKEAIIPPIGGAVPLRAMMGVGLSLLFAFLVASAEPNNLYRESPDSCTLCLPIGDF